MWRQRIASECRSPEKRQTRRYSLVNKNSSKLVHEYRESGLIQRVLLK